MGPHYQTSLPQGARAGGRTRNGACGPPGGAVGACTAPLVPGAASERSQAARELFSSRSSSPSPPHASTAVLLFLCTRDSISPRPPDTPVWVRGQGRVPAPPDPRAPGCRPRPRLGWERRIGEPGSGEGERRTELAGRPDRGPSAGSRRGRRGPPSFPPGPGPPGPTRPDPQWPTGPPGREVVAPDPGPPSERGRRGEHRAPGREGREASGSEAR